MRGSANVIGEDRALLAFLKKPATHSGVIGMTMSDGGLALVRVVRSDEGKPRVASCEYLPLPGADDTAPQLSQWVDAQGAKGATCVGVMEPGSYQLLQVEPPAVEAAEMRDALRWRIKDLVGFPVEDAAIDLFFLPEGGSRGRTAYVVAAEGEQIDQRVALFEGAGLSLRAIDITELALRNLAHLMPENETGVAVLWVGRDSSRICLFRQSNLYLARNINTGWSQLAAQGEPGELSLAPDERLLDGMVLEMQRSLDYYESHFGQNPIHTLVMLPTAEPVPSLVAHLEQNMALEVRLFDPDAIAEWDESPDPTVLAHCIAALGGALREEGGAS